MRVAIIGLGQRISSVWQHLLAAAPDRLHLVGYADPSPAGLARLQAAGLDAGRAFSDHHELLRELTPEAVLIGSPNHLHCQQLRDALAARCRVFIEKPVVISPEETWTVARLISEAGAERVQVGLVLRSSPFFRAVVRELPRIGRVVSMEANEHLPPEHGGFLMRDWRRQRAWSGSHVLEKCCHDLDLMQAICGRIARVASFGGRGIFTPEHAACDHDGRYRSWQSGWQSSDAVFDSDADIVDHQVAILETERGVRIAFHANNHLADRQRRWLIAGVEGLIQGDFAESTVRLRRVFEEPQSLLVAAGDPHGHYGADAAMARDLAACWLDGAEFPVPAKAALEAGLACMAIDRAQREGGLVEVGPWMQQLDRILS